MAVYYSLHTIHYGVDQVATPGSLIVDLDDAAVPRLLELGAIRPATDAENALIERAEKLKTAKAVEPRKASKAEKPAEDEPLV